MMIRVSKPVCWLCVFLGLSACGPDFSSDSRSLDQEKWLYANPVNLTLEHADSATLGQLLLLLQVNDEYTMRNLWAEATLTHPSAPRKQVMTEFLLMDEQGKWHAERSLWGSYRFVAVMEDSVRLPAGQWQVQLKQMMRVDTLPGVESVGIGFRPYPGKS
ncbi:MAG: hypothetical protein KF690_07150 [Bacteroidetes bacterium]|nr:hypothetical protein [Bacteroidota bacterium]